MMRQTIQLKAFASTIFSERKEVADRKIGLITWVKGTLFKLGLHSEDVQQEEDQDFIKACHGEPCGSTLLLRGLQTKNCKVVILSVQYSKIQRNTCLAMLSKEKEAFLKWSYPP